MGSGDKIAANLFQDVSSRLELSVVGGYIELATHVVRFGVPSKTTPVACCTRHTLVRTLHAAVVQMHALLRLALLFPWSFRGIGKDWGWRVMRAFRVLHLSLFVVFAPRLAFLVRTLTIMTRRAATPASVLLAWAFFMAVLGVQVNIPAGLATGALPIPWISFLALC